jgi:hypothetical protein
MPEGVQMGLPGLVGVGVGRVVRPAALGVGEEVVYLGKVPGGPRWGAVGRVRRPTAKGVWVHFGTAGCWLVPYYFLGVPGASQGGSP